MGCVPHSQVILVFFVTYSHMTFGIELVLSAFLGQGKARVPEVCGSCCFSLRVAQALVPASLRTSALQLTPGLTPASHGLRSISVLLPGIHAGSSYPSPCLHRCHVGFSSCERSCPGSSLLPHCCTCLQGSLGYL